MRIKRVLAAASVVVAAGIAPIVTASSASATTAQCVDIVHRAGYVVGGGVTSACGWKTLPTGLGSQRTANPVCVTNLMRLGVSDSVAWKACAYA